MSWFAVRRPVWGVLVVAMLAIVPRWSAAAEMTAIPSADTFVSATEPTYNYGGAGAVEVSAPASANGEFQGLLKFNLSAARAGFDALYGAGGWKLDGATLRLATSNPNNPVFNANAAGAISVSWMQNDAWVEGTGGPITPTTDGVSYATLATFLSPADESAGTINFPGGTSGSNIYTLAPSAGFAADVLSGGDLSLRLSIGATGTTSYLFNSRTFSQTTNRPTLTLLASAVPEPAAGMALVAVGGMLLARRARRG